MFSITNVFIDLMHNGHKLIANEDMKKASLKKRKLQKYNLMVTVNKKKYLSN